MRISPQVKKTLSGIAVGVASAVLAELVHDVPQLVAFMPARAQALAASTAIGVLTGAFHVVNAWGHTERVDQAVAQGVAAQVQP